MTHREEAPMQGHRSPSAARRQFGARLRQLRDNAKLTGATVGSALGVTHVTVSKFETGKLIPDPTQLDKVLDFYQVTETDARAEFHQLLEDSSGDGWWEAYDDVLPHKFSTYIGLELDAVALDAYEDALIHGLLQTRDYASAVLHEVRLTQFPDEVDRLVDVRMHRQALLDRDPALRLSVVMDEIALRRPVGGTEVLRAQLGHLLAMVQRPAITLQVIPTSVGAHLGLNGGFSVLHFDDEPTMGYTEGPAGNNYLTKPRDISRCKLIFQRLQDTALSPEDSAALIADAAKETT